MAQVGHRLYDKARIRGLFDPLSGNPGNPGNPETQAAEAGEIHLMIYPTW